MPIEKDVQIGRGVVVCHPYLVNLHGCVEIQAEGKIGVRRKVLVTHTDL